MSEGKPFQIPGLKQNLCLRDLNDMITQDWLRDEAVNFFLELFWCVPECLKDVLVETSFWCQPNDADSGFELNWVTKHTDVGKLTGSFSIEDSDEDAKEIPIDENVSLKAMNMAKMRLQPNYYDNVRYIVVPVNVYNTHWICVLVDREEKRVSIADSLKKNYKRVHESVASVLMKYFNTDELQWTYTVLNVAQQISSYECGYFTIIHALYFMLGKDVEKIIDCLGTQLQILRFLTRLLTDLFRPVNEIVPLDSSSGDSEDDCGGNEDENKPPNHNLKAVKSNIEVRRTAFD